MRSKNMTEERWLALDSGDAKLSPEEIAGGWHFCLELDGHLCTPDESYMPWCNCLGRPGTAPIPGIYTTGDIRYLTEPDPNHPCF